MPSEDRKEVAAAYETLRKKHGFPLLEEFEEEFGLRVQVPVAESMISIIESRMASVANHIEAILSPQRFADFTESGFYGEKEHTELYAFYKEIMAVLHEAELSKWKGADEKAAAIRLLLDFYWNKLKPFVLRFQSELAKFWKEEAKKKGQPRAAESYHQ